MAKKNVHFFKQFHVCFESIRYATKRIYKFFLKNAFKNEPLLLWYNSMGGGFLVHIASSPKVAMYSQR